MMSFLLYLFWPRPPQVTYDNPKVMALLAIMVVFVAASFALRFWRRHCRNALLRRLSRSWPTALLSFGLVGLLLTLARTEDISFLAVRFLWVVWAGAFALFIFVSVRFCQARYYEELPTELQEDPREKYLPKRKKG